MRSPGLSTVLSLIFCLPLALALFSRSNYASEIAHLEKAGPRYTGNRAHNQLIDRIEERLRKIGLQVRSDNYTFDYVDPTDEPPRLSVDGRELNISATYPYSGFTNGSLKAQLVPIEAASPQWSRATGAIAVVSLSNPSLSFSALVDTWNKSQAWNKVANPLIPATLAGKTVSGAKAARVQGIVFAWDKSMTDENARGQYLPFTFDFVGVPAVFVSGASSEAVVAAARERRSASLSLAGRVVLNSPSRTLWAVVEGTAFPGETVLISTHTDGPNVVEENGYIALLQLAQDVMTTRPRRTHVFVFTTGHLRIPAFTKHGQATRRWLDDHRELWDGQPNHQKAVVSLTPEHLGAVQYQDDAEAGRYFPTGKTEPEILYANSRELDELTRSLWKGANASFTRVSRPIPVLQFGEGAAMSANRIPNIALCTAPLYLLAEWKLGNERALVDMDALNRQVESFRRLRDKCDQLPDGNFGRPFLPLLGIP